LGYQLRMHHEVRGWLMSLRDTEPELARVVGEAVLALLDAGQILGPPVVLALESVLRTAEDPREALDLSYQRQLEALSKVRRGVADVATSRKRVELQVSALEQQAARLASQREDALKAAREDLASEARTREAEVRAQLSELGLQLVNLAAEEEKLTAASQRLQAKVDAFRVQKETIKASYTAAEASQAVREAIAEIDADAGYLEAAAAEQDAPPGRGSAAAPASRLPDEARDPAPSSHGGSGPRHQDGAPPPPPPGMMELRPGAPGPLRVGLLFLVRPEDTAVLVADVEHPGGLLGEYQEVIRTATDRLAAAENRLPGAAASPDAFISYDAESFLDEFFPGEEAEVEIGAGALVARNRAYTLAEARKRMRFTQAQVAQRMKVRQERVSAIERAEPGATEVRTLAAYVHALGGRLEIIAHIGNERITLR
jgi:phage shock protein A/DNA-binding XRE family transcriptional regulator